MEREGGVPFVVALLSLSSLFLSLELSLDVSGQHNDDVMDALPVQRVHLPPADAFLPGILIQVTVLDGSYMVWAGATD